MPPEGETDYHGRHNNSAFCRTCTDFKTWAKLHTSTGKKPDAEKLNVTAGTSSETPTQQPRVDCPLDKDGLGSSTWGFLHTMAAYYPDKPSEDQKKDVSQFFSIFSRIYPCESCATHFRTLLSSSPPVVTNQESLSQWLCWVHNKVNQRLDKPLFDCSKVNERWRDGWKDGSCD